MSKEKEMSIPGLGKISFKYRETAQPRWGLTSEELLLLDENILDHLIKDGRVDLAVYRRLKDEGLIEGTMLDVSNV